MHQNPKTTPAAAAEGAQPAPQPPKLSGPLSGGLSCPQQQVGSGAAAFPPPVPAGCVFWVTSWQPPRVPWLSPSSVAEELVVTPRRWLSAPAASWEPSRPWLLAASGRVARPAESFRARGCSHTESIFPRSGGERGEPWRGEPPAARASPRASLAGIPRGYQPLRSSTCGDNTCGACPGSGGGGDGGWQPPCPRLV